MRTISFLGAVPRQMQAKSGSSGPIIPNRQATTTVINDSVQFSGYWADRKARKEMEKLSAGVRRILGTINPTDDLLQFKYTGSTTQRGLAPNMPIPFYVTGDTEIYGKVRAGGKEYDAYLCHSSRMNVRSVRLKDPNPTSKEELWVHWDLAWNKPDRMVLRNLPSRVAYTDPKGERVEYRFFGEDEDYEQKREIRAIKGAVNLAYAVRTAIEESKSTHFRDKPEDAIVG